MVGSGPPLAPVALWQFNNVKNVGKNTGSGAAATTFSMESDVITSSSIDGGGGANDLTCVGSASVRCAVLDQHNALEDAIEIHAFAPLEASLRVIQSHASRSPFSVVTSSVKLGQM
jgi:hypothetical protein